MARRTKGEGVTKVGKTEIDIIVGIIVLVLFLIVKVVNESRKDG